VDPYRTRAVARSRHDTPESFLAADELVGGQIDASLDEPWRARPFQVELRLLIPHP